MSCIPDVEVGLILVQTVTVAGISLEKMSISHAILLILLDGPTSHLCMDEGLCQELTITITNGSLLELLLQLETTPLSLQEHSTR